MRQVSALFFFFSKSNTRGTIGHDEAPKSPLKSVHYG